MEKNYRAELVGCFGDPIDGNPTGVMEEAAFAAAVAATNAPPAMIAPMPFHATAFNAKLAVPAAINA